MIAARWFSRRGHERTRNSDAAALGQRGETVIAVLVDGAEKGPGGAELAHYWADVAFEALAEAPNSPPELVLAHLKREQAQLRQRFLHDIASYCMIRIDLKTLANQVWHCGDCRVGLQRQAETQWLTTPHILKEQPGIPLPPGGEEQARLSQVLTRSLTARRFREPDYQSLTLQHGEMLLLCTDGYWEEFIDASAAPHQPRDDASLLSLSIGPENLDRADQDSDADNFTHYAPTSD